MDFPPVTYYGPATAAGIQRIHNGDAVRARDTLELDRALTALACYRPVQPALIGGPMVAGTYEHRVLVPSYTQHVGFAFLAVGRGTITVTTATDTYDAVLEADGPESSTPVDAEWQWMAEPKNSVAGDGVRRALEVTDQSPPAWATFVFTLANATGSTLRVFGVRIVPIARAALEQLV